MRPSIGATGALLWLLAGSAAAQVNVEAVARFHSEALRPAIEAVTRSDAPNARRLARVVGAEFDKLPPALQAGQAPEMQRVGRLYLDKTLVEEAALLLTRAVAAWEQSMGPTFPPLGPLYADLARARRLSGKAPEAETLLQRAQAVRGNEPTQADPDAYPIFVEVAALRRQRGDIDGAEKLLRRMIDFADRMKGWEYVPNLIPLFEAYAEICEQGGRTAEARQFRKRAATIRNNYRQ